MSDNTLFIWEGVDTHGRSQKGRVSANNIDIARARLRRQGLTKLSIQAHKNSLFQRSIKAEHTSIFFRQLAAMLTAGVPLTQALDLSAEGLEHQSMQRLINTLRLDVENGDPLSAALARHPQQFDRLIFSLVQAGERSGRLEEMLGIIASYRERIDSLRRKVKKAMIYPAAVLSVAFAVSYLLLVQVVPQFQQLFESSGAELPAFTQKVIGVSEFLQAHGVIVLSVVIGSIALFIYAYRRIDIVNYHVDRLLLHFPIIKNLIQKSAVARFTRTISAMLAAGVTLLDALPPAAGASGNRFLQQKFLDLQEPLANGESISTILREMKEMPVMVTQMIAIGEQSGTLDSMTEKVADYYDDQVSTAVDGLMSLMEPIIMVILGGLIGSLVLAMYLPIFQMGHAF